MKLAPALTIASAVAAMALVAPLPVAARSLTEAASRTVGQEYGKCVAGGRLLKPHAIRFVLTGEREEGQALEHSNCLVKAVGGRLRGGVQGAWSLRVFRNLVADGLVRTDFARTGPTDFSAVPALSHDTAFLVGTTPDSDEDVNLTVSLGKIGECTARHEPEAVRLLAQTLVNSPEELAALRGLAPAFGACFEHAGTVGFQRHMLRDAAVLGYARLAYSLTAPADLQNAGVRGNADAAQGTAK